MAIPLAGQPGRGAASATYVRAGTYVTSGIPWHPSAEGEDCVMIWLLKVCVGARKMQVGVRHHD